MNSYTISVDALRTSFESLWHNVVTATPTFIVAIVVFSLGLVVASAFGMIARKLVRATKLNVAVEKAAAAIRLQTFGFQLKVDTMVGVIVEWFLAIVTFLAVANILHLTQVTDFLTRVALYVPNVLIAVLLLGLGLVLAHFVRQVVERAIKSSHMPSSSAGALSLIAEWAVIIFSVMAALTQLGIASRLIEILFSGLTFGLALAFGLSFGLGGRDQAHAWLDKITSDMKK